MTKQPFNHSIVPAQKAGGDLLSRLYRDIGISAVAAALQVGNSAAHAVPAPHTPVVPCVTAPAAR